MAQAKAVSEGSRTIIPHLIVRGAAEAGDRYGKVTDPFGHEWSVSTHKEDVSPEEMKKRGEAMARKMAKKQQ